MDRGSFNCNVIAVVWQSYKKDVYLGMHALLKLKEKETLKTFCRAHFPLGV